MGGIERLPTVKRLRMSLFDNGHGDGSGGGRSMVDVTKLGPVQRQILMEKLINDVEEDNRRLLLKMRQRMERVGVKLPTVEVKFRKLCVEAKCQVAKGQSLPSLWNSLKTIFSIFGKIPYLISHQETEIQIVKGVSGVIKPSRMTLLLGPPGCGKSTLLKALAGKLDSALKVSGKVYYNGHELENFVTQKMSAYISQYDQHIPEMTVRETIEFSARCQGVETRTGIMAEISKREKQAGITPEPDVDAYMKAISVNSREGTIQTDYILKILGLDICANTLVGDGMRQGISGGQKRRLATGEMIVGPKRVFFMDEISNGLDSSTTFKVVTCIQQLVHITNVTALISLLQPAPETFDLFDDVILFAEGKIVYYGPRVDVLRFFEDCGFRCPERKGVADFLQEIISVKDQEQYWFRTDIPHRYFTVDEFCEKFKASLWGKKLEEELSENCEKSQCQDSCIFSKNNKNYSIPKWQLFKVCFAREVLLMRRNSSIHKSKLVQLFILALITMTIFLRTRMDVDAKHATYYMGSLFYGIIRILANGLAELSMTISRLTIFYKQRDFNFYPGWAYVVPNIVLTIPLSLLESFLWTALTYYGIGYSPEVERFVYQFILFFALHQASVSLFRCLASICRTEVASIFGSNLTMLLMVLFSGFIIPRSSLPTWMQWGFWIVPVSYAEIGVSINEFLAPRWDKFALKFTNLYLQVTPSSMTLGQKILSSRGLNFEGHFYWISFGALFGFTMIFNFGFALALTHLNSPDKSQTFISSNKPCLPKESECHKDETWKESKVFSIESPSDQINNPDIGRMISSFEPLSLTFENLQYSIDTPVEIRKQGFAEKRLQLLHDITGAFRPGVLTALMGISGAGKTTLMDVLAGRKVSGHLKGVIRVGGFPKVQKVFTRILGYCEQTDIHSPQITVEESLIFSSWLRLPPEVDVNSKKEFVKYVLGKVELNNIKDALVGVPGVNGLSNEQRKRLTIAVELVSNPSIIFMDEPTSGLDARAAAIVMRTIKNVSDTGRTVVCTIHQPTIDIFETFDELILMKKGGQIIYSGPLGRQSSNLIDYFQSIPSIPAIRENYNPATWMLEITTEDVEAQLGLDFAEVYKKSHLYKDNLDLVRHLSKPATSAKELHFSSCFPQNSLEQYKACLWKQNLSYWRSPAYNFTRLCFVAISSGLLGVLMRQKGKNITNEQDLLNVIGSWYAILLIVAANNCSSVIPVVGTERSVMYREQFAGMYSSLTCSFAQVTIEFPYIFVQALIFVTVTYPAIGFYWSLHKVFWYFYATLCSFLYPTYLGMLILSLSPNGKVASILATGSYTLLNLFAGFLIPAPDIPKWWIWCYWISPTSWSLTGIFTSQYGNINQEMTAFGNIKTISSFLQDYFGYQQDRLWVVGVVLATLPLLFASLFAFFTEKLNFQRR
ncbi:hypothetical protein NMG60_11033040 [Bertholletia excelsa]